MKPPRVRDLRVWHFKSPSKTCSYLELPQSLARLDVSWSNVRSLEGLPRLAPLRRLALHRCRDLVNVSQLPSLFPEVELLEMSACGRLKRKQPAKSGQCRCAIFRW